MNNESSLFATRYSTNHINVERGMDMLNHLPCFNKEERSLPVAISFYQEVLQQWIDKGNCPVVYHKYCDELEMDLGITNFVQHANTFAETTLFKEYALLCDEIESSCLGHPRYIEIRKVGEALKNILEMPTIVLSDVRTFWDRIGDLDIYNLERSKLDPNKKDLIVDFAKDISSMIFGKLLPYKLHANNITIISLGNTGVSYLEAIVKMFFEEVQKMRGSNMRNIGTELKTLQTLIYLFISHAYEGEEVIDKHIKPFTKYIDWMCNIHTDHILRPAIYKMLDSKIDYLEILDTLHPSAEFLKAMPLTDNFNQYRDYISSKNLDAQWNGWIISGNGFFSDQKLLTRDGAKVGVNSEFMYAIEKIDEDLVRDYMDCQGVRFTIDPEALSFLKVERHMDFCKLVKPATDSTAEKIRYAGYIPGMGVFILFQISESKDVFGIGIAETKNQDRQIVKFGYDSSEDSYKFIYGGK